MKKLYLLINIALCITVFISCQGDAAKADKLRLKNQFDEAAVLYQKAADAGDAYAKWRLSNAYANGDGVKYDEEKALKLLKQAADAGCPEAECDLARAYMFNWYNIGEDKEWGKNMMDKLVKETDNSYVIAQYARLIFYGDYPFEEDKGKALKILDNVKDKNNSAYLKMMAYIYEDGTDNFFCDMKKAVYYFEKAFESGDRHSAYCLAYIYLTGEGGWEKDTIAGIEWLKKGIAANEIQCYLAMSDYCLSDSPTFKDYYNPSKGIELLQKAAEQGSGEAYGKLGYHYYIGDYVEKDDTKAFEYSLKAAIHGDENGMQNLAWFYISGTGCDKNLSKGIKTYRIAVKQGSGLAANKLYCFYVGKGLSLGYPTPKDSINYGLAQKYLLESARLGYEWGCWNLGVSYYWGNCSFEKDEQLAFVYIKKAADAGLVDACRLLAQFYREGIGCDKNPDKAKEYENKTKAKEDLEKEHLK